jgi:hypothetical protein
MALTPSELRRRKMNLLMAMSYAAYASTKASTWSPTLLFAAGEQGAWYDPSDFSTMFQDSAGTTPVTAVEQPVGLILDKSKGLALGSELWGATSDYSAGTGTSSDVGGVITISGTDSVNRGRRGVVISSLTIGRFYQITFNVSSFSGVSAAISIASGVSNAGFLTFSTTGSYRCVYVADATSRQFTFYTTSSGATATIGSISVRELPGNHASQSTSASRPVLSARVNLLTYSEQFDNAAWTKSNTTVTQNAIAAPDGATTADKIIEDATLNTHIAYQTVTLPAASPTMSVCLKAGERSIAYVWIQDSGRLGAFFNLSSGVITSTEANITSSISALGNGWYRCTVVRNTVTAGACFMGVGVIASGTTSSYTGDGTSGLYAWGADLRVTNDGVGLPAYQRIAAATDYDTSGFPLYLSADGTDDSMATSAIDFSATNKMSVFAGVRKLSDAANAMVVETSVSSFTNAGTFSLRAPQSAFGSDYAFTSTGSITGPTAAQTGSSYAAPITNVITGIGAISTDTSILRVNGAQQATSGFDQGSGNYTAQILYIGRRGGTTLPFNGRIYGLVIRGAASTDAQISAMEKWMAAKTGITI